MQTTMTRIKHVTVSKQGKRADYVRVRLSRGVPVVIGTWRAGKRIA